MQFSENCTPRRVKTITNLRGDFLGVLSRQVGQSEGVEWEKGTVGNDRRSGLRNTGLCRGGWHFHVYSSRRWEEQLDYAGIGFREIGLDQGIVVWKLMSYSKWEMMTFSEKVVKMLSLYIYPTAFSYGLVGGCGKAERLGWCINFGQKKMRIITILLNLNNYHKNIYWRKSS